MNIFEGKLQEKTLGFVRIDHFDRKDNDGEAFFLSHIYAGTVNVLFEKEFTKFINEKSTAMLYCSPTTRDLLLAMPECNIDSSKITQLNAFEPYTLQHGNKDATVTSIPSFHCIGSTMFMFIQGKSKVLYTGDMRVNASELHLDKILDYISGDLPLTSLYLDAKFCDKKWPLFPPRKESARQFSLMVKEWLELRENNVVSIRYPYYYGLEEMLLELTGKLHTQIWIRDEKSFFYYSKFCALKNYITCEKSTTTRIHLCQLGRNSIVDTLKDSLASCVSIDTAYSAFCERSTSLLHNMPAGLTAERSATNIRRLNLMLNLLGAKLAESPNHLTSFYKLLKVATGMRCDVCMKENQTYLLSFKPCHFYCETVQGYRGQKEWTTTMNCKIGKVQFLRMVYASHCSLNELKEIVNHLSPENVYPCVIPLGSTCEKVREYLNVHNKKENDDNALGDIVRSLKRL